MHETEDGTEYCIFPIQTCVPHGYAGKEMIRDAGGMEQDRKFVIH